MARARNIKPGFFKNEVLAELTFDQRLLFVGLWTLADREGRMEDRPKRIKAELFAFDSIDVDPMLNRLQTEGFLIRYEVDGVRYIHITNFVKHQDPHYKEKASEIPPPPGFENEVKATNVTRTQRQRILERDGFQCRECGAEDHLSIDHVIPVSRGGDSSDENLQVLCLKCNTSKSNKLDGEVRARKRPKQGILPGSVFDVERRSDVDPTQERQSPGFSDSGFPPPDSLQSEHSSGQPPAEDRPRKVKTAKEPAPTAAVWEAYRAAYNARYDVDPVRNAQVNGQLAQLIAKLGAEEAPLVAAHYVGHKDSFYVKAGHSVNLLLRDAEKLRTEWATGRRIVAPAQGAADPAWRTEQRQRTQIAAPGVAAKHQDAADFFIDAEVKRVTAN